MQTIPTSPPKPPVCLVLQIHLQGNKHDGCSTTGPIKPTMVKWRLTKSVLANQSSYSLVVRNVQTNHDLKTVRKGEAQRIVTKRNQQVNRADWWSRKQTSYENGQLGWPVAVRCMRGSAYARESCRTYVLCTQWVTRPLNTALSTGTC